MAFSSQVITAYFEQNKENFTLASTSFKQHPNYQIVYDYLTGIGKSLSGLTPGHENYEFAQLIFLLNRINPPSENDTLILDVLTNTHVFPYVQHVLYHWLVSEAADKDALDVVLAVTSVFKTLGLNNSDIFFVFLHFLQHGSRSNQYVFSLNSAIKKYLVGIIPPQITYGHMYTGIGWGSGWNHLYLILLEEGRPHLVKEYILSGLSDDSNYITDFILNHNKGKYIPTIVDWLTEATITNDQTTAKFITAIRLYEKDRLRFEQLVVECSRKYLAYFTQNKPPDNWERHVQFTLANGEESVNISYSAAAVHFLILHNKQPAEVVVEQLFNTKSILSFDVLQMLFYHLKHEALPYIKRGLKKDAAGSGMEYYQKIIALLQKEFKPSEYVAALWEITSGKSKPLREHLAKVLAETDLEAEQKAIQLLQSKNAEARQAAALILSLFNSESALHAVKAILNNEVNDKARDILLQVAESTLPVLAGKDFITEMILAASNRHKLSNPIEPWLNENDMPPIYYKDGAQLEQQEVRFLFYRMSRVKAMRSDLEARYVIELLDRQRSAPFAKYILKLYMDKGARPEHKYLMALAALSGNDEIVDKLRSIINAWIEVYRTKMVEYGIGALALQGSDKALRLVEWHSRKYRNKTASVGKAALQALEDAAEDLKISTHELGDRIVPDFGFEDLFKHFTINGDEYRAFIDSNFKIAFFNEDNKKLKTVPSAASTELKNEFKSIAKEVREVVKSQSLRLEYYLIIQRKWNSEEWQKFYLTNPVMFIYATKLLWGTYDRNGRLCDCFTCMEDTSLINYEDEEIALDKDLLIGIVHPIQLETQVLQNWKQKFFDLSIESIFPQLNRHTAILPESDKRIKIINQFKGRATENGSIKTTLEKNGWQKGDAVDGGYIDHFRFKNTTNNTEAILEVEGVFAGGYGSEADEKLGRLYFIDKQKETVKWFTQPKDDKDSRLIYLAEVSDIFYSEVMAGISAIRVKVEAT